MSERPRRLGMGRKTRGGETSRTLLRYIEIGNEEVIHGDDVAAYKHYVECFNLLHDAIKDKDPSVERISAAWWRPTLRKPWKWSSGR